MEQLFITFFDFFISIFETVSTIFMPIVDAVINFGTMAIEGITWLFTQIGSIIDWFAGVFNPSPPEETTALAMALTSFRIGILL